MIYCFMASALLVLSIIDWRTFEIPFCLNVFLFVLGVATVILDKGNVVDHLIGMPIIAKYFKEKNLEDLVIVSPDHGSPLSGEWWQSDWRG